MKRRKIEREQGFKNNGLAKMFAAPALAAAFTSASKSLSRLIWVGGSSDRNFFTLSDFPKIAAQEPGGFILDKDLVFEIVGIADFHELMCVAREAIFTCEFAAAIRIDGPGKGKIAPRVAAVEDGANRQREELHLMAASDMLRGTG